MTGANFTPLIRATETTISAGVVSRRVFFLRARELASLAGSYPLPLRAAGGAGQRI